ncbi:hypothetical protein FHX74_000467 [Friedmanniella endophytica]|uniref:Uncharacterized protein n=1 Tax=Microlunatus kandeliicorticis TaxID=1759536 RepID=A0A7W3IPI9_9ACTN|nr:hypothetical protein [Microlunatus kandeliicorticis]MBA8792873.1 hypothetical protein [Microlunatus kandeliicorticis]
MTQIKIMNGSPLRSIVDIRIYAAVLIPFIDREFDQQAKNLLRVPLPLSVQDALRLEQRRTRVINLRADDLTNFSRVRLTELGCGDIADATADGSRQVRDLLDLKLVEPGIYDSQHDPRTRLVIEILCKDSITGRDFALQIGPIYSSDLKHGHWKHGDDSPSGRLARAVAKWVVRWRNAVNRQDAIGFIEEKESRASDHLSSVAADRE